LEQSSKQGVNNENGPAQFLFKASATALSGSIRKPYYQDLGDHAAVSTYAGSAGHATARNDDFILAGDLAYKTVTSEIKAEIDGYIRHTKLETTIEKLNVRNRVTADLIVCRFVSYYDIRSYPEQKYPRILPVGSRFVGLRVDGELFEPELPPAFYLGDSERDEFFSGRNEDDPRFYPGFIPAPLHVPDLGTLFFAEWVWKHPQEQREQYLTMLRMALGSDSGASLLMASGGSDGRGYPP
jgi:hypothetical protein